AGTVSKDGSLDRDGTVYLYDRSGKVIENDAGEPLTLPASAFSHDGTGIPDDTMQNLYHDSSEIAGAAVVANIPDGAGRPILAEQGPDEYAREVRSVIGQVPDYLSTGVSHAQLLAHTPGDMLQRLTERADTVRQMQADLPSVQANRTRTITPYTEALPGGGEIQRDPVSKHILSTTDADGFKQRFSWSGNRLSAVSMEGGGAYTRSGDNLWTAQSPDGLSEPIHGDFSVDPRDGALIETRNYLSGQKQVQTRYGLDGSSQQFEFSKDGVQVNGISD
ncbi:MAG TPA: hypothetical protein V6C72_02840, partial [Chroococcales cyanobacterium]